MKALAQAALASTALATMRVALCVALPVAIAVIFVTQALAASAKDNPNQAKSEQSRQA